MEAAHQQHEEEKARLYAELESEKRDALEEVKLALQKEQSESEKHLRSTHTNELKALRSEHANATNALEMRHNEASKLIQGAHSEELYLLKESHAKQSEEERQAWQRKLAEHEEEKKAIHKTFADKLQKLEMSTKSRIQDAAARTRQNRQQVVLKMEAKCRRRQQMQQLQHPWPSWEAPKTAKERIFLLLAHYSSSKSSTAAGGSWAWPAIFLLRTASFSSEFKMARAFHRWSFKVAAAHRRVLGNQAKDSFILRQKAFRMILGKIGTSSLARRRRQSFSKWQGVALKSSMRMQDCKFVLGRCLALMTQNRHSKQHALFVGVCARKSQSMLLLAKSMRVEFVVLKMRRRRLQCFVKGVKRLF